MLGRLAALACLWTAPALACAPDDTFPDSFVVADGGAGLDRAWFSGPTDIYDHGVLGDAIEPGLLTIAGPALAGTGCATVEAGPGHVFEDTAPRLVDLTGNGLVEVIVVRSSVAEGAQLAIYGLLDGSVKMIAATPYIGLRNRWLAPVGAVDLDGDGAIEIAYIDRPHLAKTLVILRWQDGALVQVAAASGLTNHRIGEPDIGGGIRDCGQGPEMVLASADWSRTLAVRFAEGEVKARDLGPYTGRKSFAAALTC
jgi:hypothetical protein